MLERFAQLRFQLLLAAELLQQQFWHCRECRTECRVHLGRQGLSLGLSPMASGLQGMWPRGGIPLHSVQICRIRSVKKGTPWCLHTSPNLFVAGFSISPFSQFEALPIYGPSSRPPTGKLLFSQTLLGTVIMAGSQGSRPFLAEFTGLLQPDELGPQMEPALRGPETFPRNRWIISILSDFTLAGAVVILCSGFGQMPKAPSDAKFIISKVDLGLN